MADHDTAPELEVLTEIGDAWTLTGHGPRLRAVRERAQKLRERLTAGPAAVSVRTLPVASLVYPTRFALGSAALSPAPYVNLVHRALLVQFHQKGELRNLLFNPTDTEGARRAPYSASLLERFGRFEKFLSTTYAPLEAQLAELGLAPDEIHYVAFDHFHLQDLRRLLGTEDGRLKPRFPNAKLLAPAREWDDWDDLHPVQRAFYVADGKEGVLRDRVAFTRDDLVLGDGVALVRTPGHTSGNQTLFVKTDRGVWGVSENGVCADNWSPRASGIAGVASAAKSLDLEVIMNSNTLEYGAEQYTAMVLEKTVVDPVAYNQDFVQMFPSSEATPSPMSPGVAPSYLHGAITHGDVVARGARKDPPQPAQGGFGALSNEYR